MGLVCELKVTCTGRLFRYIRLIRKTKPQWTVLWRDNIPDDITVCVCFSCSVLFALLILRFYYQFASSYKFVLIKHHTLSLFISRFILYPWDKLVPIITQQSFPHQHLLFFSLVKTKQTFLVALPRNWKAKRKLTDPHDVLRPRDSFH